MRLALRFLFTALVLVGLLVSLGLLLIGRADDGAPSVVAALARARSGLVIAGLAAAAASAVAAGLFYQGFARPIAELRDIARALARGDLSKRPALAAPGELGELSLALHDMTEQLAARLDALASEQALLSAVASTMNEGVLVIDPRRSVVRMNEIARRLLQVREDPPFSADVLPREPVLREALAAALAGESTTAAEVLLTDRTLALTARPLIGGGAILAILDLTPVRRLETVRRDFVANVSHELKTPLTVVGGFAETLLDDSLAPEQRHQFAETIRVNARRMQRIVDDLLDLSRIESGGWVPNPTRLEAHRAAGEALAGCLPEADAKRITVDVDAAESTIVFADSTALRQVLTNLIENAIRHTDTGTVTVFAQPATDGVWMGVRDTGVGIPAEHLTRIFERFYRVDAARARAAGGTGLGLAIVKHLAEAHGGRVRAESIVGRGTTIAVLFPSRRESIAAP